MTSATKRQLLLHVGSPKTGTSAIQFSLYSAREYLRSRGILYPEGLIQSAEDPKHQSFFGAIQSANSAKLAASLVKLQSELTDSLHTVVLSSEGFYHHMHEFRKGSWRLIEELGRRYSVRVIVYLRPQAPYLESIYRQYLKNPRGINAEFGSSMTIQELMAHPRIKQNLDYYDSIRQWAAVLGEDHILVRRYVSDIVDDFLSLLRVPKTKHFLEPKRNLSVTRDMAELLRSINTSFDDQRRAIIIANMERAIEKKTTRQDATFLSPAESRELMACYQECNCRVARQWLGEKELFPDYRAPDCVAWTPARIDLDGMLAMYGA